MQQISTPECFSYVGICIYVWCSADRIEWALIQLLLFDAHLTHPGQQLRRRNEQTSAQQEGKHIGFLSKDVKRHSLRHSRHINKHHCSLLSLKEAEEHLKHRHVVNNLIGSTIK